MIEANIYSLFIHEVKDVSQLYQIEVVPYIGPILHTITQDGIAFMLCVLGTII
jgi:hypothetical protein